MIWPKLLSKFYSKIIQAIVNLQQIIEKNPQKEMPTVKSWLELLLCKICLQLMYQLGSDFVKQLFRIQIQKAGKYC